MRVRITKYNPVFRNALGHYLKDEWTSSSDIGESFEDKKLTLQEYLDVESKLTETIIELLKLHGCFELTIAVFCLYDDQNNLISCLSRQSAQSVIENVLEDNHKDLQKSSRELLRSVLDVVPIENGQKVNLQLANDLIKLCLRELLDLRLISSNNTYVFLTHDYYVYVGTDSLPLSWDISIPEGIFVEYSSLPYEEDDED